MIPDASGAALVIWLVLALLGGLGVRGALQFFQLRTSRCRCACCVATKCASPRATHRHDSPERALRERNVTFRQVTE
jgi:hypothetical protein